MKLISIAVFGPRSHDVGRELQDLGPFEVRAEGQSFTQLVLSPRFPTRYLILDETDPDCTRARIAIAKSLSVSVVLVGVSGGRKAAWDVDAIIDGPLALRGFATRAVVDNRSGDGSSSRLLSPITPRERETFELWSRLGRLPAVAAQLGVGYETAATLLKRARKKLAEPGGGVPVPTDVGAYD